MVVLFQRGNRFSLKITNPLTGKPKYRSLGPGVTTREQAETIRQAVKRSLETKTLAYALAPTSAKPQSIGDLATAYVEFAEGYYLRDDGTHTSQVHLIRSDSKRIEAVCPKVAIPEFSPRVFKHLREFMVEEGRQTRDSINESMNRIKRMLKWGVENELVHPDILAAVQAVAPLKKGRTKAREGSKVLPANMEDVRKAQAEAPKVIAAMIDLQLLCGARPGEIVLLRPRNIDTSRDDVWIADLSEHKNQWRGIERFLYFGRRAQIILKEYMLRPPDAYMFNPREVVAAKPAPKGKRRRPNQKPNRRKTSRRLSDHYTAESYRRAISRACEDAHVEVWCPNQLRHEAGTNVRRVFGLEGAQVYLGHANADITQVYAEVDREKAIRIAQEIG